MSDIFALPPESAAWPPKSSLLNRHEASDFLSNLGLRVAPATLAKYASIGGGPVMRRFGRRVVYEVQALLDWANSRLSPPRRSTSDPGEDK